MFRKLSIMVVGLLICGNAFAAIDLSGVSIPDMKQGIAWSLQDNEINYLSTVEVAKFKNVSLELGYSGRAKNSGDKIAAVLSYPIVKLKDLGVDMPIIDLIELNVGAYAAVGRVQLEDTDGGNEWDAGLSATLINLKF